MILYINVIITRQQGKFMLYVKRTLLLLSLYFQTAILKLEDYKYFSSYESSNKILQKTLVVIKFTPYTTLVSDGVRREIS